MLAATRNHCGWDCFGRLEGTQQTKNDKFWLTLKTLKQWLMKIKDSFSILSKSASSMQFCLLSLTGSVFCSNAESAMSPPWLGLALSWANNCSKAGLELQALLWSAWCLKFTMAHNVWNNCYSRRGALPHSHGTSVSTTVLYIHPYQPVHDGCPILESHIPWDYS